ncbi:hypothetical protein ABW20_dc0104937 [Dactylellina cionopaga]|nr:hypothetical protein ABW20_dc0104937 [Dactylellina cionopaga]
MSIYLRVARPCRPRITLLLRAYSSKATLKPRAEDALKIWEELSSLDLSDPKQLFDDDVVDFDAEFGEGKDGSDLPVSPIMDRKAWKRRFRGEKKLQKTHPKDMTEEELDLMKNPYEGYYRRVLPSFFLQEMHPFVHPETKEPWILPTGIRSRDETKVTTGASKYLGMNHAIIEFLKTKRWRKLQDSSFAISAVWRMDMEDFILEQLQNRVYEKVAESQRWIMSANRDGGKWEDMKLGCLLVWENGDQDIERTNPNINKVLEAGHENALENIAIDEIPPVNPADEEERVKEIDPRQQPQSSSEVPARRFEIARTLINVKGKFIPSYKMHILLGKERAAGLKKQLKIEDTVKKNAIVISSRTMKVQMWLWRLAGYTRNAETSLFKDFDALESDPSKAVSNENDTAADTVATAKAGLAEHKESS